MRWEIPNLMREALNRQNAVVVILGVRWKVWNYSAYAHLQSKVALRTYTRQQIRKRHSLTNSYTSRNRLQMSSRVLQLAVLHVQWHHRHPLPATFAWLVLRTSSASWCNTTVTQPAFGLNLRHCYPAVIAQGGQ